MPNLESLEICNSYSDELNKTFISHLSSLSKLQRLVLRGQTSNILDLPPQLSMLSFSRRLLENFPENFQLEHPNIEAFDLHIADKYCDRDFDFTMLLAKLSKLKHLNVRTEKILNTLKPDNSLKDAAPKTFLDVFPKLEKLVLSHISQDMENQYRSYFNSKSKNVLFV